MHFIKRPRDLEIYIFVTSPLNHNEEHALSNNISFYYLRLDNFIFYASYNLNDCYLTENK